MPQWSGLFDNVNAGGYSNLGLPRRKGNIARRISILMARETNSSASLREVMRALNGVAAGATATFSFAQVGAVVTRESPNNGGLRTINTITPINRATTAGDVAITEAFLTQQNRPATYPVDAGGNGGGNKRGW